MTVSPLNVSDVTYPRPDPDLMVVNITSDSEKVEVDSTAIITVKVENIAYGFLNFTQVAFYEKQVNESSLIDVVNCTMDGWEGRAKTEWSSSSSGNYTIIAMVDPNNLTREIEEGNNLESISVEVVSYNLPGLPDLAVLPTEILSQDVPFDDESVQIEILVHNEGSATASSVEVLVKEMPANITIDSYTINGIGSSATDTHYSTWNASNSGKNYVNVDVDPRETIDEGEEEDNSARNGFEVMSGPDIPDIPDPGNVSYTDCNGTIVINGDVHVAIRTTWYISQCDLLINGNVTISGTLQVVNESKIALNTTDNARAFTAFLGGVSEFDSSMLVASTWSHGIVIIAENGSTIKFLNESEVRWTTGGASYNQPSGIQLYTSNVTIDRTQIREGRGHGLYVGNGSSISHIGNSTITGNGFAGAFVNASHSQFWNVTFAVNHDGILFSDSTGLVDNGTIQNVCEHGIFNDKSSPDILYNDIQSGGFCAVFGVPSPLFSPPSVIFDPWVSKHPAIYNNLSSPKIVGNTIEDFKIGVQIDGASSARVAKNDIVNNLRAGIFVNDSGGFVLIEDNPSISYHRIGVVAQYASPTIENNSFVENGEAVSGNLCGISVRNNTNMLNNDFGVVIKNSPYYPLTFANEFLRNASASGKVLTGVYAENSKAMIVQNVFDSMNFGMIDTGSSSSEIRLENEFLGHNQTNRYGIIVDSSSTKILDSNLLKDFHDTTNYDSWALRILDSTSVKVEENTFNHSVYSLYVRNSSGSIKQNSFDLYWKAPLGTFPTGGAGIYSVACDSSMTILENWINYTGYSIYLENSSPNVKKNRIEHNFYYPGYEHKDYDPLPGREAYHDISRCAICVYGASSPFIANNTMVGGSYGVSVEVWESLTSHPTISNNTFLKTGWKAIGVAGVGNTGILAEIIDNKIRNSTGAAVMAEDWGWVNVTHNVIEQTNGQVLLSVMPEDKTTYVNWSSVLLGIWGSAGSFQGKYFVDDNMLSHGNTTGIYVYSAPGGVDFMISSNTVVDYNWSGFVDERVSPHQIESNDITGNLEGIRILWNANATLLDNTIRGDRDDSKGIIFSGPRSQAYVLETNNSLSNATYGMFLHEVAENVTIKGIDWVTDTTYGIYSDGSSPTIDGVDIQGNEFGLFSTRSSVFVKGSSIFQENEHGGYIFDTAADRWPRTNPRVYNSSFDDNAEDGLIANRTTVVMRGSTASNNFRGIVVNGTSDADIQQSDVINNSVGLEMLYAGLNDPIKKNNISLNKWGVFIQGSFPTIQENDFWSNNYSLYIYQNSGPYVRENDIASSSAYVGPRYGVSIIDCNSDLDPVALWNNTITNTNQSLGVWNSGKGGQAVWLNYTNVSYSKGSTSLWPIEIRESNVHLIGNTDWSFWSVEPVGARLLSNEEVTWKNVGVYVLSTQGENPRALYYQSSVGSTNISDSDFRILSTSAPPGSGGGAIEISGNGLTLYNNSIVSKASHKCIWLKGGKDVNIRQNNIASGGAGIMITGGSADIEDNLFSQGSLRIRLYGSWPYAGKIGNITIRGNDLTGTGSIGIDVDAHSQSNITIEGNDVGNYTYGIHIRTAPLLMDIHSQNDIHNNTYGIYIKGGNATIYSNNSIHHNEYGIHINTTYAPHIWDNNTIENNSKAGIWIGQNVGTFQKQIWWNSIVNNTVGIDVESDPGSGNYFHCECNWWRDADGPYDPLPGNPDTNDNPAGEPVSDYFWYRDPPENRTKGWLTGWSSNPLTNCTGGI